MLDFTMQSSLDSKCCSEMTTLCTLAQTSSVSFLELFKPTTPLLQRHVHSTYSAALSPDPCPFEFYLSIRLAQ